MHSLHRISAVLFYAFGITVILGIILIARGVMAETITTLLNVLDLPLLFVGMLYAGSSLVLSMTKDKVSVGLSITVFGFLAVLFAIFVYLNFAFPFQVTF
jgi:hypothetical protein